MPRRALRRRVESYLPSLLRSRGSSTPFLLEWQKQGGCMGAQLRGVFSHNFRRALLINFRPSSVSCKPSGHVADLAFSPVGSRRMNLAVGSTEKPHEVGSL